MHNDSSTVQTLIALLGNTPSAHEGAATGVRSDDAALRDAIERAIAADLHTPPAEARVAAESVVREARAAAAHVSAGGRIADLTDLEISAAEAIVQLTGRPALRYLDGRVQMPLSDLGQNQQWELFVATARREIDAVSASVGRLVLAQHGAERHLGTAWRSGADLVVTNRHVAALLAKDPHVDPTFWVLDVAKAAVVDYAATEASDAPRRMTVCELVFCAPERDVDIAVLRLGAGPDAPPPLSIDWRQNSLGHEVAGAAGGSTFQGRTIYVVGHPYREISSAQSTSVFGRADGLKRCSPGLVKSVAPAQPVFEHDCSTLGGNSGSCVVSVDQHFVVGIHAAGLSVDSAGVGRANLAIGWSRLDASHRLCKLLGRTT